jgi:hypothetical protein
LAKTFQPLTTAIRYRERGSLVQRSTAIRSGFMLAVSLIVMSAAPATGHTSAEPSVSVQATGPWSGPVAISSHDRIALDRGALAATTVGGRRALHVAFTGTAKDRLSYALRYARSTDGGSTWSVSKRLNGDGKAANYVHVSAAGSHVYLAWLGWKAGVGGTAVYFRANPDNGAPTAWRPTIRLTTASDRPRQSQIAASGASVFVLYRDKAAKSIYLKTSRDHGRTWTRQRLTHWQDAHGAQGPALAVSGGTVAVAWKVGGRVESRISINGGRSFGSVAQVGVIESTIDGATISALGSRVVLGWMGPDASRWIRTWSAGTWAAPVQVPMSSDDYPSSPEPALRGMHEIGVLFSTRFSTPAGYHWRYSSDDGATWAPDEALPATGIPSLLFHEAGDVDVFGWIGTDGEQAVGLFHRTAVSGAAAP